MTTLSERGQVQLTVPIDRGTRAVIRDAAKAHGITQGAFIERAVHAYVGKRSPALPWPTKQGVMK